LHREGSSLFSKLSSWLAHPLTRNRDIDDPAVTHLRRRIIREKRFLSQIYREWYQSIATALPPGNAPVLELGSGAGFLTTFIPQLITSELFVCQDIDVVTDAQVLPFADQTLRGIVMTDVLHHIAAPRRFFSEAVRCVYPGGRIVMIEPWVTNWSRLIYQKLHHEPFHPEAAQWEFPAQGPLSGANGALPWMVFARDRAVFEAEFPQLTLVQIITLMPFTYILSGGVSLRSLMPGWTYPWWRQFEQALQARHSDLAMFALIVLSRTA
jgi:SAM-dependent methyltransferase